MKIPATNARFIDEQGVEYELGNGVLTIGRADIIAWHEARVAELAVGQPKSSECLATERGVFPL